jgi:hypothetical protein
MIKNIILLIVAIFLASLAFKVLTGILALVFKIGSMLLFAGVVYLIYKNVKKISS